MCQTPSCKCRPSAPSLQERVQDCVHRLREKYQETDNLKLLRLLADDVQDITALDAPSMTCVKCQRRFPRRYARCPFCWPTVEFLLTVRPNEAQDLRERRRELWRYINP